MSEYVKEKLKIIKDFGIKLTPREKARIVNCDNETQVDNIVFDILHSDRNESQFALYTY